jgi:hypothetical protein
VRAKCPLPSPHLLTTALAQFTALFWDPKSNWIAVVFKGTSPIGEWNIESSGY